MNKKVFFSSLLVCLLALSLSMVGCDNGTSPETTPKPQWRSEFTPKNHSSEAGHKYGEWVLNDTRLWIGNNNGNCYVTVNISGEKTYYDLVEVDNQPAGSTSSFTIKGTSRNPDKAPYTIEYIFSSDNESINITDNGACPTISTGTYSLSIYKLNWGYFNASGGWSDVTSKISLESWDVQWVSGENAAVATGTEATNIYNYCLTIFEQHENGEDSFEKLLVWLTPPWDASEALKAKMLENKDNVPVIGVFDPNYSDYYGPCMIVIYITKE